MNDLYLALGRAIAGLCPAGFRRAVLNAAFRKDGPEFALLCEDSAGEEDFPPIDAAARDWLAAALGAVRKADDRPWSRCTVTLTAGGGFAMDVFEGDESERGGDGSERRDGLQILTD